ncbi:MAG: type II toxin-antitoxin system prevent-host-death family antitoxin [Patescibacteria group bacterium]
MPTILEKPKFITKNGKPKAVILDIRAYQKLLELVEDKEDLAELRKIKMGKTSFKELKGYLKEGV